MTSNLIYLIIMAIVEEQQLLSTEIESTGLTTFSVRVRRRFPDFVNSVNLKYVKLGYHYLINHGVYLAIIPVMLAVLGSAELEIDSTTVTVLLLFTLAFSIYLLMSRQSCIYLVDFACYKPNQDLKVTKDEFIQLATNSGKFDQESLEFQSRILHSSGIGDETYVPKSIGLSDNTVTMKEGRAEASTVMFGALDELFDKTGIRPKDISILVVNCTIFNPTPSLSAMIINRYKMRGNILSFNLGGMGCSAGIIALDLARDMLLANPNSYAVVVSTEMVGYNWYPGKDRSMLIPNCYFRMGCSAALLSNRRRDYRRAKYRLELIVRTHKGADDRSFRSIYQEEDSERFKGIKTSKDLIEIGADALKANITTLGPLVLPFSEQLLFFSTLIWRILSRNSENSKPKKPYIPDYKLAFEHFCVHAASKLVLDELQRNLGLSDENLEASRAVLHRFGNTSSSSIWYELAYLEAKGRVKGGDRVWQLAFGSGLKCNSAVWKSLRKIKKPDRNPWLDCIDRYPHDGL